MVKPTVNMISSAIAHMPLLAVWRDSGVTQKHGFDLTLNLANTRLPGQPPLTMADRVPKLMDGTYDFASGIHIDAYKARALGDKRISYLAQPQNELDDRLIGTEEIRTLKDLEGKKVITTSRIHCVYGNLKTSLRHAGVDVDSIEFAFTEASGGRCNQEAVDAVVRGDFDAANVDIPFDRQGEKYGLHRLDLPTLPVVHNVTVVANDEWVRQDEETTYALLRSLVDAIHFFKTQKNRVCEILDRELAPIAGISGYDEVEHLQEEWAAMLFAKPYPHPLAVWNVWQMEIAHDPTINFISPFELWNTSYLRVIDDSQYIDELYGGADKAINPSVNAAI